MNVTQKNAPEMEAYVAIMENTPTMKRLLHAVSEGNQGNQGNPNGMVAGKPQIAWASQHYNAKNVATTTDLNSMDGRGVEPTISGLQARQGAEGGGG